MPTTAIANITDLRATLDTAELGRHMYQLISALYPICRSITGHGFRKTMAMIAEHVPIEVRQIATGTRAFDWTVPKEWNIRDAYVRGPSGEKVIDFRKSNLHVVGYSLPVNTTMPLAQLKEHLFTLPDHPDWIPYRTSYYRETWGFCLAHNQLMELQEGEYEVLIDSTLEQGYLNYGEYYVQGKRPDEILISCHACHPSLCNDNLSGVALTTFLAKSFSGLQPNYSYRFLFIPGGIGSAVWLSLNEENAAKIKHGLVVTCVGDAGGFTYKKSRRGDAEIDRAAVNVLRNSGADYEVIEFSPYGYDERNYCSPGFDLPLGSLTRTTHARYPEYHTSADDLTLVKPECLAESFRTYMSVLRILEQNRTYLNQCPKCEPQLGKRGLYGLMGGLQDRPASEVAMLWVLNLSDGQHTLLDISDRAGIDFDSVSQAADRLRETGLLDDVRGRGRSLQRQEGS